MAQINVDNAYDSAGTGPVSFPAGLRGSPAATSTSTGAAVTLTNASNDLQLITPSANIDVNLPSASVIAGRRFTIVNQHASNVLTVKSSGGNTVISVGGGSRAEVMALQATPTTAAHWLVVSAGIGLEHSEIFLSGGAGNGSSSTAIREFVTEELNTGSAISYVNNGTLGAEFTINEAGIYSMTYVDNHSGAFRYGVTKNSAQLQTGISSVSISTLLAIAHAAGSSPQTVTVLTKLAVGDVIRAHTDGTSSDATGAQTTNFRIVKVASL